MRNIVKLLVALLLVSIAAVPLTAAEEPVKEQIREIRAVMPKFGIPMREVGERFQNMYYAAQAGNWGLASYMAKSMNAAMNPIKVSQAYLYPFWENFFGNYFKPVTSAIETGDARMFEKEFTAAIDKCNSCHYEMGFAFIKVRKPPGAATQLLDFNVKSRAADFRE
ncbi:MAG TPA: hypothetical protein VFF53_04495 [Geobacteraceae bacterium]|nr:hypothetical protein [Geobacteraceae bacterium]